MLLCDLIGEAVPKIQGRWMDALSPTSIGRGDPRGRGGRNRLDFEAESVDQARHFLPDVPAGAISADVSTAIILERHQDRRENPDCAPRSAGRCLSGRSGPYRFE